MVDSWNYFRFPVPFTKDKFSTYHLVFFIFSGIGRTKTTMQFPRQNGLFLSIPLRFAGRNTESERPEPFHLQLFQAPVLLYPCIFILDHRLSDCAV